MSDFFVELDTLEIQDVTQEEMDEEADIRNEELSSLPNIAEIQTVTTTREFLDQLDYELSIPELTSEQLWEK